LARRIVSAHRELVSNSNRASKDLSVAPQCVVRAAQRHLRDLEQRLI
jgi:hypothetical protein